VAVSFAARNKQTSVLLVGSALTRHINYFTQRFNCKTKNRGAVNFTTNCIRNIGSFACAEFSIPLYELASASFPYMFAITDVTLKCGEQEVKDCNTIKRERNSFISDQKA
jgi:hypothetical protein